MRKTLILLGCLILLNLPFAHAQDPERQPLTPDNAADMVAVNQVGKGFVLGMANIDSTFYVGTSNGVWVYPDATAETPPAPHKILDSTGLIMSVLATPEMLITGDYDGKLQIWDRATETLRNEYQAATGIYALALHPDGEQVAIGLRDGTIDFIHRTTLEATPFREPSETDIFQLEFVGDLLLSLYSDWTLEAWEFASATSRYQITSSSVDVALSPDGKFFALDQATYSEEAIEGPVSVYATSTGEKVADLERTIAQINELAFSPDGRWLIAGGWQALEVWNLATETLADTQENIGVFGSTGIAFADERALISFSSSIYRYDFATQTAIPVDEGFSYWHESVAFSPDGTQLVTGGNEKLARIWDLQTGAVVQTYRDHINRINNLDYAPDGTQIGSCDGDEGVHPNGTMMGRLWSADDNTTLFELQGHMDTVNDCVFSPDGQYFLTAGGSLDGAVVLWDTRTGEEVQRGYGHQLDVYGVAFSADGSQYISGGVDGNVVIWDTATGENLKTLTVLDWIVSVAHGGDYIAAGEGGFYGMGGEGDYRVALVEVATEDIRYLEGHQGYVNSVVFSPDGSLLASASNDKTVKVWDVATGELLVTLPGHTLNVTDVAFRRDGTLLASSGGDGIVMLWGLP